MNTTQSRFFLSLAFFGATFHLAGAQRNVIIFIADGLRAGSVNPIDSPTFYRLRMRGVNFTNSHALFPTFTTPNASVIATGHYLGDTGDFGNTLFSGYPIFNTGNFLRPTGTPTPFIENDQVLMDLNDHYEGNYLGEETLLSLARKHGYNTAAIGKLGPAAIQDISQLSPEGRQFAFPQSIILDDLTGAVGGIPLRPDVLAAITKAGLPTAAPARNQPSGNNTVPGTLVSNRGQQQYFIDVTTKALLPLFKASKKPFVLVYWSRDPDATQHNQGDSLNRLRPGINGTTSKSGIANADANLTQILTFINRDPILSANTDVVVTADHGFATISRHDIDNTAKRFTTSFAARFTYVDANGRQEVNSGFLPPGFLAIDLAHFLQLPLFDPDSILTRSDGTRVYEKVDPTLAQTPSVRQHPAQGDGLIGGVGSVKDRTDAGVVVAANGGADLIYVINHDKQTVKDLTAFLSQQDYVNGLFVGDEYGPIPGSLPLSSIRLLGTAKLPLPSIIVCFKNFSLDPGDSLQTRVQVSDTTFQQGQGMHGGFGRESTFNFMAVIGPDFKRGFADPAPVSNADITPTLANLLGFEFPTVSSTGRVITEAIRNGPPAVPFQRKALRSTDTGSGKQTVLVYQQIGSQLYFDEACFSGPDPAHPCR